VGAIAEERVSQIVSFPTPKQPMPILEAALLAHCSGLCVVPTREDGSKAPIATWREYQRRLSTEEEIRRWYGRCTGIGIVCGEVSGRLEMLEFEGRAATEGFWQEFKNAAAETGLYDLLERIKHGYGERTPSGGFHLLYRCPDGVEGNLELAKRPPTEEEAADDERAGKRPTPRVLVETRGEGGYVVVAPSSGRVHQSGLAYELVYGGFDTIVTITAAERAALLELARSLDRMPLATVGSGATSEHGASDRQPGTDFNLRADWATDVLEPAGWSLTGTDRGGRQRWYRAPSGRPDWTSATVSADGEILYVFSTSTDLPVRQALSKFAAYTHLHHGGDFRAAARALRSQGYGQQRGDDEAGATANEADRPVVVCTDRGLRDLEDQQGMADDALRALLAANARMPSVFERARQLVRVGRSIAGPDGSGHPVIEQFGRDALAGELASAAWFVTVGGRERAQRRISPPEAVVRDIIARGSWPGLPSLSGVVETPVLRPDGSILSEPGYDVATWLFYAPPAGFRLPAIAPAPGDPEVRQAVALLDEALCDFPFADQASHANAYALLLTPFIRHALGNALVPMAIIDATTPGAGKGLLLDLTTVISTGSMVPKRSAASDNDEWRKELLAAAIEGATYFVIDNADEPLGSAALDSAITAGRVAGRILGQSRDAVVSIRWTWVATGNNILVRGDLARRCYWIRLVPDVADPSQRRDFRHPRLLGWARERRAELVAAALTIIRAWFVAGCPPAEVPAFGSFEAWSEMAGGIVAHAGIEGFLGNLREFRQRTDRGQKEWEKFIGAWWSVLGSESLSAGELARRMRDDEDRLSSRYAPMREALPANLTPAFERAHPPSFRAFAVALGTALTRVQGRWFATDPVLRFESVEDAHRKVAAWRVAAKTTATNGQGAAGSAGSRPPRSDTVAGSAGSPSPRSDTVAGSAGSRPFDSTEAITEDDPFLAGSAGSAGSISPHAGARTGAHVHVRAHTRAHAGTSGEKDPADPADPASDQQGVGGTSPSPPADDDWEVWRP
jgi:Bifunctional DNA primase/polymerase, N-terminal